MSTNNDNHFSFTNAARSLALPLDDDLDDEPYLQRTSSLPRDNNTFPSWTRRSSQRTTTTQPAWLSDSTATAAKWQRRLLRIWVRLTPLQKTGLIILNLILLTLSILFLIYNQRFFAAVSPVAKRWRELPAGWLILWSMTFICAFPPMIGYSTCVTIAGFVFGMNGWFIVSTANVAGSVCSFIVSRTVLKKFVERLTEKNTQFAALSLVLKHDGLKLLTMIRLCPLPYSLSNGAISTIPTVTWQNFGLATAIASPKLALHIFVGSRLGDLAENGDKMDTKTKIVSYISIVVGMIVGIATGYFVYVRTKARAQQLEAEEGLNGADPRRSSSGAGREGYADDFEGRQQARRGDDDISLHPTYDDDPEALGGYRDEFTDDEDAAERDVFDLGDGYEDEEDGERRKKDER